MQLAPPAADAATLKRFWAPSALGAKGLEFLPAGKSGGMLPFQFIQAGFDRSGGASFPLVENGIRQLCPERGLFLLKRLDLGGKLGELLALLVGELSGGGRLLGRGRGGGCCGAAQGCGGGLLLFLYPVG